MRITTLLRNFIFCLAVFFYADTTYAVTLEQCKILTLQNSKLLDAYENLIKASIYSNQKDKSTLFPQVSGFYQPDYVRYGDNADFAHHGWRNQVGATVSIDIQKILANYPQLSGIEIEKSRMVRRIAESEIIKNLTQNYYNLYVLLKKKSYYGNARSFIGEHIKDIEDLQSKGMDVKLDAIRAKVQLKSLYVSVSNINQEVANTLTLLNSLMNTEYKESDFSDMDAPDMTAIASGRTVFDENVPDTDVKGSYIEGVERSIFPKIAGLEQSRLDGLDVKLAEERYRQSKYSYFPSLQGGFEHNAHTIDPSIETDRMFIGLSIDIFDFGRRANEEKQLKYSYESQKNMFAEGQRRLKVQIDQLITEIENIQTTYQNASDNMKSAEQALDTAKEYYQQGKIKETDLLSVFSEYMNAKDQSYDTLYDFLSKKAELDSIIRGAEK